MLTDTHCHLYFNLFQEDLNAVLERALEKGITRILVPGIDLETSKQAIALSEQYPGLYAAVGIHPNELSGWDTGTIEALRELAAHPKVRAIGEIGLDFYREHSPHDLQKEALQAQLALASELSLPVVIHNRESWGELWPMLSSWQAGLAQSGLALADRPGVLHSFDGTLESAQSAIAQNFSIGISGPVTFKNAPERQELVAALPVDHLLTETDAPYLTPHPYRGRRNEPAFVAFVLEKIAELQHEPAAVLEEILYRNAERLFRWDNTD